jgi:dipeptide transport system substrate-binding protein
VTYEWGEYLKRVRTDDPDVAMLGGTWDFPDPAQLLYSYWSCDAAKITKRNVGRWCYKPFDDAVTKANEVTDQAQRAELYKEAQKAFYDDIPGMLFADARAYAAIRNNVEGFKIHFFGGQPFVGVSLGH